MFEQFENCILNGHLVTLRPLVLKDEEALIGCFSIDYFKYFPIHYVSSKEVVSNAIERKLKNISMPFLIIENKSSKAIGMTSFANVRLHDKSLEIGSTFIENHYQKLGYNVECKLLLLQYLFENLSMNRIEFKADKLNTKSNLAMEKLGFVKEGVFRNHMIMPDGRLRDSVYYSVIKEEWPQTKRIIIDRFNKKLSQYHN
ncbi:GNAT family N-acetyltransferase [Fluviispira sanaruensis]|uniref:N-acetyltransferase n=1 Tax=Fluviispira sanaruensis TaxID=2493639 RepID=A0A4P2VSM1_FLUSA|nr:GNAT family protein [Fluviispira sanaruensis]BBH52295.1 N-acetyltransferase [Fluviispira sanaruensis]